MNDTTTTKTLTYNDLKQAVTGSSAAFRCRRKLQPAGGAGDKVFPPTFAGAVYAVEQRHVPGRPEPLTCVVLDTVQSQANRMEQALQDALDGGRIKIPVLNLDFSEWSPSGDVEADKLAGKLIDAVGNITSLQVPHRLADAILRDSQTKDGTAFRKSDEGKALNMVSQQNATALYKLCPTALIFGMWDSTGPKGGLGAKFERAIVSEVVGIGATVGDLLRGVRHDPFDIRAAVKVLKAANKDWSVATPNAKGAVSPSEVNHSSVPFPKQRKEKTDENLYAGATIEYGEQVTTLSLVVLRRLRFPVNGQSEAQIDVAARTVLAALGLCAATLAFESGMGLRSRCLLWPEGPMKWELLEKPGDAPADFTLTSDSAIALLAEAAETAASTGLRWPDAPIQLVPQQKLVDLVRLSQLEATKEEGKES
jgi:CRISPR-associated protein Csb1